MCELCRFRREGHIIIIVIITLYDIISFTVTCKYKKRCHENVSVFINVCIYVAVLLCLATKEFYC